MAKNKALLSRILDLCFLLTGFIIGKSISAIPYFNISKEIDVIAILSIFATIFIAYLVYNFLDKNKEDRVREKELILKRVEEIYNFTHNFYLDTLDSNVKYSKAGVYN